MTATVGHSLAVTSGKGGVGKTGVALNLGVALAQQGRRVLLVDADLGLGNLALMAGLAAERTLEEVLRGECGPEEAALTGPAGVMVLPAGTALGGDPWVGMAIEPEAVGRLRAFEERFDWLVIDTGAGIAAKVQDFVLAADEALLVVTPEPAAVADAYATVKVLLGRRSELPVGLLVNMAETAAEAARLHAGFQELTARFLGAGIDNRGYIPLDRYVREAAKRQTPFALAAPPPPAAQALERLAGQLLQRSPAGEHSAQGFFERVWQRRSATTWQDALRPPVRDTR